jgi:hypothetical protein
MSNELNPQPHSPDYSFNELDYKLEINKLNSIINDLRNKLGEYNTITLCYFNPKTYPPNIALKASWAESIYYFIVDEANELKEYGDNYLKIFIKSYIKITKEEDYSMFDNKINNSKCIERRNKLSFHHPEDAFIILPKNTKITIISERQYDEIIENCNSTFDNLFFGLDNPKNDLNTLY